MHFFQFVMFLICQFQFVCIFFLDRNNSSMRIIIEPFIISFLTFIQSSIFSSFICSCIVHTILYDQFFTILLDFFVKFFYFSFSDFVIHIRHCSCNVFTSDFKPSRFSIFFTFFFFTFFFNNLRNFFCSCFIIVCNQTMVFFRRCFCSFLCSVFCFFYRNHFCIVGRNHLIQ